MTMTTAILESRHFTTGAKENDRAIEQGPRDGCVLELPGEPRDVPAIEWKHAGSIARVGIPQTHATFSKRLVVHNVSSLKVFTIGPILRRAVLTNVQ